MNLNPYTFGLIYKVSSKIGDCTYYGSTTDLMKRIENHKNNYKSNGHTSSKLVLKYPDYKFEIVEYYSCEDKKQLERREGYYHRNYDCVNKIVAGRTRKQYREDHKQEIKINKKQYYEKHKEKLKKYSRQYQQKNKEKMKQFREKNKIKMTCSCGSVVSKHHKARHERSKKHLKYINNLQSTKIAKSTSG